MTYSQIDPKYLKKGTEVVICNTGSAYHGVTGTIIDDVEQDDHYVTIQIDPKFLKRHGLVNSTIPFTRRELCLVEDDPEEGDYTCDCDKPHCSTCNSHMRGPNCPSCDHPANF